MGGSCIGDISARGTRNDPLLLRQRNTGERRWMTRRMFEALEVPGSRIRVAGYGDLWANYLMACRGAIPLFEWIVD